MYMGVRVMVVSGVWCVGIFFIWLYTCNKIVSLQEH